MVVPFCKLSIVIKNKNIREINLIKKSQIGNIIWLMNRATHLLVSTYRDKYEKQLINRSEDLKCLKTFLIPKNIKCSIFCQSFHSSFSHIGLCILGRMKFDSTNF